MMAVIFFGGFGVHAGQLPGIDPGKPAVESQHFPKFFDRIAVFRGMRNKNVTIPGNHGLSGARHQVLLDPGFDLGFDSSTRVGNFLTSLPQHQPNWQPNP